MEAIFESLNLRQPNDVQPQPLKEAVQTATAVNPGGRVRKPFPLKVFLTVVLGLATLAGSTLAGVKFFQHLATHEETDDAYVTSHLHQVSTRLNGTVQSVLVDDNEHVKAGQVLVTLDPRDLQVKVEQCLADLKQAQQQAQVASTTVRFADTNAQGQDINAQGSVSNAVAMISKSEGAVREAQADLEARQADLKAKTAEVVRAQADFERYVTLERQGAVTTSQRDTMRRDYVVAQQNEKSAVDAIAQAHARIDQARDSVNTARAQLLQSQGQKQLAKASAVQTVVDKSQYDVAMAAVERARTALAEAQLNLSYASIVAPTAGRIGKKSVEAGQRIEPGQPLLTIVADNPWVVANFKETQLKKMHSGQSVDITIDSFPDHRFLGHVLSFSPASGASFAVLPSDNATGNFTKIVQRLPVKIILDPASVKGYEDKLAPGMSAVTSVNLSDDANAKAVSSEELISKAN